MELSKLLLATVGATVLLGALVGGASARNVSVSNQSFRSTFRAVTFEGAFGRIACEVLLEGSLHNRTFAKRVGSLIGYITQAILRPCATGTATILRETLPWHVRYAGFAGTLPNITSLTVHVINFSFRWREPFATCLARSTEARPWIITFNRNVTTRRLTSAEIGGTVPTDCFGQEGSFRSDRGTVTLVGNTTAITVTLI